MKSCTRVTGRVQFGAHHLKKHIGRLWIPKCDESGLILREIANAAAAAAQGAQAVLSGRQSHANLVCRGPWMPPPPLESDA